MDRDISMVQGLVSCYRTLPADLSPPDTRLIGHRAVILWFGSAVSLSCPCTLVGMAIHGTTLISSGLHRICVR
jgi:hypothetical protein